MSRVTPRVLFPLAAVLVLAPLTAPPTAWAAGGSSSDATAAPDVTPADRAKMDYERGLRYRDKAWKLEEKAANASGAERGKLEAKIEKEYRRAVRAYESAIEADPGLFQAHSSLGYALRRLGDYEASLAAYDRALEIEPRYSEAIEYRAEAYLGLDRLDEAKEAYLLLFRGDRKRADELMAAMKKWVEVRTADPGALSAEEVRAFAGWVEEREKLAAQTASLGVEATGGDAAW